MTYLKLMTLAVVCMSLQAFAQSEQNCNLYLNMSTNDYFGTQGESVAHALQRAQKEDRKIVKALEAKKYNVSGSKALPFPSWANENTLFTFVVEGDVLAAGTVEGGGGLKAGEIIFGLSLDKFTGKVKSKVAKGESRKKSFARTLEKTARAAAVEIIENDFPICEFAK